jgi:HK97 family phage portal protein
MSFWQRRAPAARIEPPPPARTPSLEDMMDAQNASPENPSTPLSNPDAWLLDWGTGGVPLFGPPVSEQTAMAVSTVFRCVSLLSGLLAGIPLGVYEDDPKLGRIPAPDHRLADMLGAVPFPGRPLTSFMWRESWGLNVFLWGNHYSVIRYDRAGRVIGFEPTYPWSTNVKRLATGRNLYTVTWPDNSTEIVPQEDMIHIAGPGFDGIRGLSRIQSFARNAVSLARTFEENIGQTHENSARPTGAVEVSPNISPKGLRRQEAWFQEKYAGRANAGKVLFLDQGSKYTQMQMSPEDLNTIAAMNHSAEDICRFFGVHPVLAGLTSNVTAWGTGIEQLTLGFLRFTMESEFQRVEHELNAKLFANGPFYARYDRDALLAMDALAAAQVRQTEINSAQLTPNEARKQKQRPAMENGDVLLVNSTMITLDRAINPPPPPPPPPPKT